MVILSRSGARLLRVLTALALCSEVLARAQNTASNADRVAAQAARLIDAKDPKKAAELLERAVRADPQNAGVHALLGQAYLDLDRPKDALPHLEAAVRLRADDSPTLFNLGVARFEVGQTEPALATFSQLAAREPEEVATRAWIARAALRLGKRGEAEEALAALRRLAPEGALHAQMVEWCFQEEAGPITEEQIRFALRRNLPSGQGARVHYLLSILDQRARRLPQALEEARRALALDESREEYFAAVANLGGLSGIENVDRQALQRGLAKFPDSRDLLVAKALLEMHSGQVTDAFHTAEQLQKRHAEEPETYVLRGRLELADLSFEKAAAAFRRAVALRDADAPAHFYLGLSLRRLGSDQQALEQFRRALSFDPNYSEAHFEYGRLLFDLGEWEKAAGAFSAVIRLSPNLAVAYNLMSQTQRKLGKSEEAERYLARFKELAQR